MPSGNRQVKPVPLVLRNMRSCLETLRVLLQVTWVGLTQPASAFRIYWFMFWLERSQMRSLSISVVSPGQQ